MFSKEKRIPREVIESIFKQKNTVFSDFLMIKILDSGQKITRFAVIVTKKVEKSAVKRHFLKRRYLNILKKLEKEMTFKKIDILVFVSKKNTDKNFQEIETDFINVINKNKFLFLEKI
jgi:ribonuclease P protein component